MKRRSNNEIKARIIEIATKMDEAKVNHEWAAYYIWGDKKLLLEWVLGQ